MHSSPQRIHCSLSNINSPPVIVLHHIKTYLLFYILYILHLRTTVPVTNESFIREEFNIRLNALDACYHSAI
jgi:hypothetical protein